MLSVQRLHAPASCGALWLVPMIGDWRLLVAVLVAVLIPGIASQCARGSCRDMPFWECYDAYLAGCNDNFESYVWSNSELSGTIPAWIASLDNAQAIYLDGNQLTGTLPEESLASLVHLEEFDVARNELEGPVPATLCSLKRLSSCALRQTDSDANAFECSDECPDICTNFQCIDDTTTSSPLQCPPTELCYDSRLEDCPFLLCDSGSTGLTPRLILTNHRLSGSIPNSLADVSATVGVAIRMDDNELSGTIPDIWDQFPALTALNLARNSLTGTLPPSLGSLTALTSLSLNANQLSGTVPLPVCNLSTSLSTCNIDDGLYLRVDCRVPVCESFASEVCGLTCAEYTPTTSSTLHVNATNVTTPAATTELWKQCGFGLCNNMPFAECSLEPCNGGSIPSFLDLSSRSLTGTIPGDALESILPYISGIDLSYNSLSGTIPDIWSAGQHTVQQIQLQQNNFVGSIPSSLGLIEDLQLLNVLGNQLTGTVPVSVCNLQAQPSALQSGLEECRLGVPSLECGNWLDDDGNSLTARHECGEWLLEQCGVDSCAPQRETRGLETHCLSMPLYLCDAAEDDVGIIDLAGRNLFGTIPTTLLENSNFSALELGNNQLTGTIPWFQNGGIRSLYVHNNSLTGTLPVLQLDEDARQLNGGTPVSNREYSFDLSGNKLSGSIVSAFVNDPSTVRLFDLSRNNLTGSLPFQFCDTLFDDAVTNPTMDSGEHFCSAAGNTGLVCSATLNNMHCGYSSGGYLPQNPNKWCGIHCTEAACTHGNALDRLPCPSDFGPLCMLTAMLRILRYVHVLHCTHIDTCYVAF